MQVIDRYQLLIDSIPDYAIYMLDAEGYVTTWNPGARRFKGYEAEEIMGRHFSLFYVPEDREAGLPERSLSIAASEGRFEKEGWRVRQDGSRFWAHVIIDAIRDESGALLGFAKITRDITEKMEAQRSLEVAREALFQSQKMEAVGQLTGGVAHDFNNLLTAIMGSLELLRKRIPPDPKTLVLLDNALQGVHRGAALTQRMLAFARRQDLHTEAISVVGLVNGMSELLQRSLGPMVRMEMHFPAVLPPIEADLNQLESALLNLAVNARDAMPAGGSLVLSARQEVVAAAEDGLNPGNYVCLAVADSGVGMDETTLKRAVEPFYTTKGVGKGTGLGLSMVHGMAQQLGGKLKLSSTIGHGTTAELWLPVSIRAINERTQAVEPVRPGRHLNILTVDDDALVLTNIAAMLEDLGHSVVQVSSAAEALEVLQAGAGEPFDLLITDHAMPHMTGYSLGEAVLEDHPGLPVLLVSGFAELPNQLEPRFARLAKPFAQRQLADAIGDVMASSGKRDRAAH